MITHIADQIDAATYELNVLNNLLEARQKLRKAQDAVIRNRVIGSRPFYNMNVASAQALVYQYENQLKDLHHGQ